VNEFVEVAGINDIPEGTMKKFMVSEHPIILARVRGRYYSFDEYCPHLGGDLFLGTLKETTLTCPIHHSKFDIRDGHVIRWTDLDGIRFTIDSRAHPPHSLRTYPVRVEGNKILIYQER
jgi:3-phenylpropionate/trans-cinnamate dioxygenase ferredoxin subunit